MSAQDSKQRLLLGLADEVECEMKKLGLWSTARTPPGKAEKAFGADSMSFEEWLQHVFLPHLKQAALIDSYPSKSSVATAAVRNLDGIEGTERLIAALSQIDSAIEQS
jgi:uncharacterized protein YqcC (DUF446 family)